MSYSFKTKPFKHQEEVFHKSYRDTYYGLFMEMGLGKSKVAIDTMGALYKDGDIKAALIVAPKGVYDNWVKGEIPRHLPDDIPTNVMRWQPNLTKKYTEELKNLIYVKQDNLKVLVINVEALSTEKGVKFAGEFLNKNRKNMMIVDESTTIKNKDALRTRNVIMLGHYAKYRRILTGSPVTKSPLDLYSQCMFLSPNALGFRSFFSFQARYAIVAKRTLGARSFNEVTGYQRLDELNGKLEKFSSRLLKTDCLDLPDKIYVRREVPLSKEQENLYIQMKKLALARLEGGELATTASILTQIMRLHQICCGFLQTDEGEIKTLANNRYSELMNVIEETQGKVIIWASYTHDIKTITKALSDKYGPDSVAAYYGETPQKDRQEIVDRFQDPDSKLQFFVGQPRTGGYGITLTAATTMVYFSNSYDLEIRLQSEDRAHRIGQKSAVTYVDLVSPKTVDEKIIKALREKINIAGQVLGEEGRKWLD